MNPLSSAADLLADRYPSLAFLLQIDEDKTAPLRELKAKEQWPAATAVANIDVLYIYGLGLGQGYDHFHSWLEANEQRQLVFIEEHLPALRFFLTTGLAPELLRHPRVHIRFSLDQKRVKHFAAECAADFPVEHIEVIASTSYKNSRFYRLRNLLLRATTVEHALVVEGLHYHLLAKNFFANYFHFSTASAANELAGKFRKVPAVICGAGPSLSDEIDQLRALDNRALVIAGGSAITALSQRGIVPHMAVAIDPNFEEYDRFRSSFAFEVPLFYVNRVHPRIFATCNGPLGYLHTLIGGTAEMWMEEKLKISSIPLKEGFDIEAMSVTTTAIELAYAMGCDPIILVGIDLAFTGRSSYIAGVVPNPALQVQQRTAETRVSEKLLRRKSRTGKSIDTLVKWVMEASAISRFAAKHRSVKWINATAGGLGFEKIPYRPLSAVAFDQTFDLRGRLAVAIEERRFSVKQKEINAAFKELRQSLRVAAKHCCIACEELARTKDQREDPETGKLMFAWIEIEELAAYQALLKPAWLTLTRTLDQRYPTMGALSQRESWARKRRILEEKWHSLNHLIAFYAAQLDLVLAQN
ncbi:MAG: 6-hydroxymethylpterin diphosphokinase MptE-like protein [Chlamydiota bacterium]